MPDQSAHDDELQEMTVRQFLTYRLNRLHARLNAQASRYLALHAGVTISEWRVIALVGDLSETTLTELSNDGQLDKGLLSRAIHGLVDRGLIEARQDSRDQRIQRLTLTAEGQALYARTLPRMRARQRFLMSSMTPDELTALLGAFDKLEAAADTTEFPD